MYKTINENICKDSKCKHSRYEESSYEEIRNEDSKRVKQTKQTIWYALLELLIDRGVDDISVQMICDKAGIHRTTFYKYFRDIFDLISGGFDCSLDSLFLQPFFENDKKVCSREIVDFFVKYKKSFVNMEKTKYLMEVNKVSVEAIEKSLNIVFNAFGNTDNSPLPWECIVKFCSGGLKTLCSWWAENPEIEQGEFSRILDDLIIRTIQMYS